VTGLRAHQRAQAGVGWSPQERNIFRSLTVEENLTAVMRPGPWSLERIYAMFPRLAERKRNMGGQLSGGEQQMLAIGRALALNPRLLLLDEPLEGLAPIIVDELLAALRRVIREEGMSAIVVEQSARKILPLTDVALVLERGTAAFWGASNALASDAATLHNLLGVAARGTEKATPASH
jgi:branched-chain amino acid transport system ATP-binding protein